MRLNKIFILFVVGLMGCVAAKSQPPAPAGLPSVNTTNYYKIGWIQSDSGFISALRDTTVRSRFPGLEFMWQHSGVDTSKWLWNGSRYVKQLNSQDTLKFLVTPSFLASQGFLKNISGLLNQGTGGIKITGNGTLFSPYVVSDTSAGVIDSAVNPGLFLHQNIVGTTKTLLADTSFATGFSGYYLRRIDSNLYVTPTQLATKQGIITTGTNLQYFRGDLSLATFPTNLSAFTNGPGYISGNQPITFTANSSGDVTGTFTNPTVLTPLLTLKNTGIGAGSCTNCNITFDAQGREVSYAPGSGGTGGTNSNVGSGYRFAIPNTNNIKTLFVVGGTLDSTTNANAITLTVTGGGSGTVTSVAQTIPTSLLTIGGSPITTAGTLAIGLANAGAHSYWGNNTGSSGTPLYVTNTQLTADLNLFTTTLQGLVPLSGGGTTNFLRADGTWAAPPGGGSGGTLVNLGAGYRIGFPNTNNLRTLFCAGCTLDSTTNANGLTLTVAGVSIPPNIGSGFRVYSPQVPGFKTIFAGTNVTIDSTTNTNGLTIIASAGSTTVNFKGIPFGNASNTPITDTTKLKFDSTGNGHTYLFVNAGAAPTGDIIGFGNSITFGLNAVPQTTNAWLYRLSNILGAVANNQGLSSSTLEKQSPLNPFGAANAVDRVAGSIPTKDATHRMLIISYGVNDLRYNGTNYNPTNFASDYQTVLNSIFAKGWSASQIVMLSTSYMDSALAFGSFGGNPPATYARQKSFDSTIQVVANTNGIKYIDIRTPMISAGGIKLLSSDGLHPNNAGHLFIANYVGSVLDTIRINSGNRLSVNGRAEFNNIIYESPKVVRTSSIPMAVDSAGNVGVALNANYFGKGLFGGAVDVDTAVLNVNGRIDATALYTNGYVPVPTAGVGLYFSNYSVGTNSFIASSNWGAGTPTNLSIQGFGGQTTIGGLGFLTDGSILYVPGATNSLGTFITGNSLPTTGAGMSLQYVPGVGGVIRSINLGVAGLATLIGFGSPVVVYGSSDDGLHALQVSGNAKFFAPVGFSVNSTPSALINIGVGATNIAQVLFQNSAPTTSPVSGQLDFHNGLWIADSSATVRDTFGTRSWVRNNFFPISTPQNLTATQLATTINIAISGGNNQNLALANATHAGLVDSARWFLLDSIYRGLKVLNLFAANGLTAAAGDSFYLGGSLNQNTTIATAGFSISLTGLPNKATALSTDSIPLIDIAGKIWKLPVPSGGGGSGTVTSVATGLGLSGGTITTTGTLILDTSYAVTKSSAQVISGAKIFSASTNINAAFATNGTVNLTGLTNTAGGPSFKVVSIDTLTGKLSDVPFYTTDTTGYASGLHFFTFNGTKIVLAKDTSIYNSDGTIAGARTVSTGANLLSIHGNSTTHSGLDLSTTSFYYGFPGALNTDANITVADGYPQVQLAVITANRTITLPSASADGGRILIINNPAQTFTWSFATTVSDPASNTITNLTPSTVYVLEAINSQWLIIGQYGSGDNLRYNHTIFAPSTGGSVTLVNNRYNIINPTTGLATLTITLPSSPANNDVVYVKFTQGVAAVTYSGGTVLGGLAAPIIGSVVVFTYDSSTSTWY